MNNCCLWQTDETKLAKSVADEQAVFGLYSLGVITARDEWVYDYDAERVGSKVRFIYQRIRGETVVTWWVNG